MLNCPSEKPYYNYDSNVCLNYCGADGSNKRYYAFGKNVCYSSCLDIPPGSDGKYIYEVEGGNNVFICYDSSQILTLLFKN